MKNIINPLSQNLSLLCILLLSIITYNVSSSPIRPPTKHNTHKYIKDSCHKTLYPNLCYNSLAKYARKIKTNPKTLATAALLVSLNKTRATLKILKYLSKSRGVKPRETVALLECVEEVTDAVYELKKSVKEFNHSRKGSDFEVRMNDVQTWVSAALTDVDTCMDDFSTRGKMKSFVRVLILRVANLTSIALAFINDYAAI